MVEVDNRILAAAAKFCPQFVFTYTNYYLVAEQHVHYVFKVDGPSGISFEVVGRFSALERWYSDFSKDFKENLKRLGLESAKLPQLPKKSLKDNIAELKRKESFY